MSTELQETVAALEANDTPTPVESVSSGAETPPPPSLEDMAAHTYTDLIGKFRTGVDRLNKKQLKRVAIAIAEYPLGDEFNPEFYYHEELTLITMGMKIFDCKYALVKAVIAMKEKEAEELKEKENEERKLDQ